MHREGRVTAYRVGRHLRWDLDELRDAFREQPVRANPRTGVTATLAPNFDALETRDGD
jgi:hypothetical protein